MTMMHVYMMGGSPGRDRVGLGQVFSEVWIIVEVTLIRAEHGSQRSDQPENVNFEPIIRGLKSDIFY